jgi:nucleoside kinase
MISVVGHTAIDHISRVPELPKKNGSTSITERKIYFGGGAANIAAGIATLGSACTLVSAVGGDFAGGEYDQAMQNLGIQQQFFVVPEAHTPTAFMFTDKAGDQVTYFEWGASSAFTTSEAPALDFVHMATADPHFNRQVAEKSRFASFDPGQDLHLYPPEDLAAIIGHIDILFANQHEVAMMAEMLGTTREEIAARVPLAVFTCGGEGSSLFVRGVETPIPAVPVTLVDPTGAGDAYRAGFLSAYDRGYDPLTCCRVGTVTASFVVEKTGCQTNLPDWERMAARYSEHFGALVRN